MHCGNRPVALANPLAASTCYIRRWNPAYFILEEILYKSGPRVVLENEMEPPEPTPEAPAAPEEEEEEEELEEPEEGDTAGMVKYQFAKLFRSVFSKKNRAAILKALPKLLLVLGIVALVYWYFFVKPQPGTLFLQASVYDAQENVVGAAVSLTYADGTLVRETITDEGGAASIADVPSEQDLVLKITPSNPKYEAYTNRIRLASRQNKRVDAKIGKKTGLAFAGPAFSLQVPAGCQRTLVVEVENKGTKEEVVTLVPDENLAPYARPLSSLEFLSPGDVLPVPVVLSSAPEDFTGSLRIQGTSKKVEVTIQHAEKPPVLQVDFDKTDAADFQVSTAQLPMIRKSQVRIKNAGDPVAPSLSELNVSISGDFASWVALDLQPVEEANRQGGLPPGKQLFFGYTVEVPAGTGAGPYSGRLKVTGSCDEVTIPLNLVVS